MYAPPTNHFVADFIGNVNCVAAEVVAVPGVGQRLIDVPKRAVVGRLEVGEGVRDARTDDGQTISESATREQGT